MSNFDIRALLQYVPQFRGRNFVVVLERDLMEELAWHEVCMDLQLLQGLGVGLVLNVPRGSLAEVHEQLARLDVRVARSSLANLSTVLSRGQAALLEQADDDAATGDLAKAGKASKIIVLQGREVSPHGAWPADQAISDEPELAVRGAAWCQGGVQRVHFIDGRQPGAILSELFSNQGIGLMIYTDAYQEIHPLQEEDIPELLSLIGRSVFDSNLLDRSYEDVARRLSDYHVLKIDGNVVGSVAVHYYDQESLAEIACLRIKDSYEGLGYGRTLVTHAEEVARGLGAEAVFALSQNAGEFFRKRAAYEEWGRDELPAERAEHLSQSGRSSLVFGKRL